MPYGGLDGGVVNAISKAGEGNVYHGDIMGFYENNTQLMRGSARDYLRQNPLNDYLYEYVNTTTSISTAAKTGTITTGSKRSQPRRLRHQGQAVVLRLHQSRPTTRRRR